MVITRCAACVCFLLAHAGAAHAQAAGQLWANVIVNWLASDNAVLRVDVEPKTQAFVRAAGRTFMTLEVTPHVEFTLAPWADLVGELSLQRTTTSDHADSVSTNPRVGVELHILSRILRRSARGGADREKLPRRRLAVSSLLRLERQNTFFDADTPTKSSWRFRDRFDLAYPLNRRKTTDDGAVYVTEDNELFFPLERERGDPLVDQVRVRAGLGYRANFAWRFEALYVWTGTRNAGTGKLAVDSHAFDFRIRREF